MPLSTLTLHIQTVMKLMKKVFLMSTFLNSILKLTVSLFLIQTYAEVVWKVFNKLYSSKVPRTV